MYERIVVKDTHIGIWEVAMHGFELAFKLHSQIKVTGIVFLIDAT